MSSSGDAGVVGAASAVDPAEIELGTTDGLRNRKKISSVTVAEANPISRPPGSSEDAGQVPARSRKSSVVLGTDGRINFQSEEDSFMAKHDPFLPIIKIVAQVQLLDLPLFAGIVIAMIIANAAPGYYEYYFSSDRCFSDYSGYYGSYNSTGNYTSRFLAGSCVEERYLVSDCPVYGYQFTLHFLANDIIMVGHFALVMKEVTEALLPGGSLNPPTKALNPILVAIGGFVGPVLVFFALLAIAVHFGVFQDEYDRGLTWKDLSEGWGVVTATDVSVAWLVARIVFGHGHPAIDFLLLVGVVADFMVALIIAFYYQDAGTVSANWLLLVVLGMFVSFLLRKWHFRKPQIEHQGWSQYIIFGGIPAWIGLIKAHIHPALALNFIVPFMPGPPQETLEQVDEEVEDMFEEEATHGQMGYLRASFESAKSDTAPEEDLHRKSVWERVFGPNPYDMDDSMPTEAAILAAHHTRAVGRALTIQAGMYAGIAGHDVNDALKVAEVDDTGHEVFHVSTLDSFEQFWKVYVDFGVGFFALCNAGVELKTVGAMTWVILVSLIVGKFIGIVTMFLVANKLGFPSPFGVELRHICMVALIASIGLTVSLFVADYAFPEVRVQGDARLGAVLSGFIGVACWVISRIYDFSHEDVAEIAHHQLEAEADAHRSRKEPRVEKPITVSIPSERSFFSSMKMTKDEFGNFVRRRTSSGSEKKTREKSKGAAEAPAPPTPVAVTYNEEKV